MITSFRVKNLRSIRDSGDIRLAKINIFVGKNSAGKSTLLRTLPLLRQSVERPTKGPILWFGRLVDFGSYQNAVNAANKQAGVELSFQMSLKGSQQSGHPVDLASALLPGSESSVFYRGLPKVKATVCLGLNSADEVGKVRLITLKLGSDEVEIRFDQEAVISEVLINSSLIILDSGRRWFIQEGKLFPYPIVAKETSFGEGEQARKYWRVESSPFLDRLVVSLSSLFHGNTSKDKITEIARTIRYCGEYQFFEQLKGIAGNSSSFNQNLIHYRPGSEEIRRIRHNVLLCSLDAVFKSVDKEISDFASGVKYVEPIRATAERYYRLQDLAVDEIDSRGENAAMFMSSLSALEMIRLEEWMVKTLGFSAHVEKGSGHVQVKIKNKDGFEKNIADLGFGYSQLLPIILQIWRSIVSPGPAARRIAERAIIAIEQPELHLHPQFQAQMADVLVAVSAESRAKEAVIFLETHSEHLINRFGQLVAEGTISKDDIQVIVLESEGAESSTVRMVCFDKDGFLDSNWPAGFFVPEVV